jgi:hypothetical protein
MAGRRIVRTAQPERSSISGRARVARWAAALISISGDQDSSTWVLEPARSWYLGQGRDAAHGGRRGLLVQPDAPGGAALRRRNYA